MSKEEKAQPQKPERKKVTAQMDVLPNAEMGKVVTRFAPEPSGYLHIGHVKAAMLCYHLSKRYNGKMILRFDDTNPSKEKGEFEENIMKDLQSLEIIPDKISHSSDYFDKIRDYMFQMIKDGNAYCDNTESEKMKEERTKGIKSKNHDNSIEENIRIWNEMIKENPTEEIKKYCVRGKIDYTNANKCLRDPVFYRFSDDIHPKCGPNYHLFPCYDFICPILDSIEGITHAMRANEYSDRIPMYEWVQDKFKLRKVIVYEFSRMNLIQTILSKRYLKWFVDTGRVDGWDDPRFPTVQALVRRGLVPDALKDFCLELGASKKNNLMEWDKIYAVNRNYIDHIAKRYFAVGCEGAVKLIITNMSDDVVEVNVDWHQKNKDLGSRIQKRCNHLVIEKEDAATIVEGQKLTLYKWCNSIVEKVDKDNEGKVTCVYVKLTPEDKDFKNTHICHWVPMKEGLYTKVMLVEYSHLITVQKFEEGMKIEDIINNNSKFETEAYAESIINEAKKGDKIQFERRGYFIVDKLPEGNKPMYLNFIPDGKTKRQSIIKGKVDDKTLNTEDIKIKRENKKAEKKANREEKKAKKAEKKAKKAEEKEKKKNENNNNKEVNERIKYIKEKYDITCPEPLEYKPEENKEISSYIESTLLNQDTTKEDITKLCNEAKENKFYSILINECYVKLASELLKDSEVKISSVINYPLGNSSTEVKLTEANLALKNGAKEISMVINCGYLKSGLYKEIYEEINTLSKLCHDNNSLLKVIIEVPLLEKEDLIIDACLLCSAANADFVESSTGYLKKPCKLEQVKIMRNSVGGKLGVKIEGIKSNVEAKKMIEVGASRIGTVEAVKISKEK